MSASLHLVSTTAQNFPSNIYSFLFTSTPPHYYSTIFTLTQKQANPFMAKFKKSQILMLALLTALLFVTPLISSSSRPKYLYFVINFLIIALGAEAGLLSAFSKPLEADQKKQASSVPATTKPVIQVQAEGNNSSPDQAKSVSAPTRAEKKVKIMEKSVSEKINGVSNSVNKVNKVEKVKKCPSMPSLFFIGGGDNEAAATDDDESGGDDVEMEAEVGDISGQELFAKAETFIGNFYKQLKMQREDSWKRIHGFYQRAF